MCKSTQFETTGYASNPLRFSDPIFSSAAYYDLQLQLTHYLVLLMFVGFIDRFDPADSNSA